MKVCKHINVQDENFNVVSLRPGDTVPTWAEALITNPKVIWKEDEVSEPVESIEVVEEQIQVVDYSKTPKKDLIALLEARGLPTEGKVDELRERLTDADAQQPEEVDVWSLTEDELRELAAGRGIDVSGATTQVELATMLESGE